MDKNTPQTSTNLEINVSEPIIFFRGGPQEAVGCMLRGDSQLFEAGTHTYSFSLFLPGTLPETIDVPLGTVSYKLTATVGRSSSLLPNLNARRNIIIIRTMPDHETTGGGIAIARDIKDMFAYEISLQQKAYPIGGCIKDLDFKIVPLSDQLRIHLIRVQLIERTLYRARGNKHAETRVVFSERLEDFGEKRLVELGPREDEPSLVRRDSNGSSSNHGDDQGGSTSSASSDINVASSSTSTSSNSKDGVNRFPWNKPNRNAGATIELEQEHLEIKAITNSNFNFGNTYYHKVFDFCIPKCTAPLHPTCTSETIKVMHLLKFTITITLLDAPYQRLEVKIDAPITVLSCRCSESVHVTLPRYDNDSYLCPCDPRNRSGSSKQFWVNGRLVRSGSHHQRHSSTSSLMMPYHHNHPPPSYEDSLVNSHSLSPQSVDNNDLIDNGAGVGNVDTNDHNNPNNTNSGGNDNSVPSLIHGPGISRRAMKLPPPPIYTIVDALNGVPRAFELETQGYPPDEAASLEKLLFRKKVAPELFWGAYLPANPDNSQQKMIGFVVATLTTAPVLTEASMDWHHEPDGQTVCIHSVCVDNSFRRRGVASSLLQRFIEHCRKLGYARIALISHEYLLKLYQKNGFVFKGESKIQHGSEKWFDLVLELKS
ncbi:6811_t:CDS:2 [Ambispora leptoticha]|uniref:6811_t:CDS:1 n=1 Tax=Ambispora leptoticha TaxID=144679 RepID=A0A9N8Z9U2_9GLOM|nr:6811_t:CDS:2 [Ambispora leptoticha]